MIVYGIYAGCKFEGGGCGTDLYRSLDQARIAAIDLVSRNQKEQDELYKDDDSPPVTKWNEPQDNYWENGIDCVSVQKFKVKDFYEHPQREDNTP